MRYYILLYPPMMMLAAQYALMVYRTVLSKIKFALLSFFSLGCALVAIVFMFVHIARFHFIFSFDQLMDFAAFNSSFYVYLIFIATLSFLTILSAYYIGRKHSRRIITLFILFFIVHQSFFTSMWLLNKSDALYSFATSLEKIIPENSIIAGDWAPAIGLDTKYKTIYTMFGKNVNTTRLQLIKPDYLLFKKGGRHEKLFRNHYPQCFINNPPVAGFNLYGSEHLLIPFKQQKPEKLLHLSSTGSYQNESIESNLNNSFQ